MNISDYYLVKNSERIIYYPEEPKKDFKTLTHIHNDPSFGATPIGGHRSIFINPKHHSEVYTTSLDTVRRKKELTGAINWFKKNTHIKGGWVGHEDPAHAFSGGAMDDRGEVISHKEGLRILKSWIKRLPKG